MREIKMLVARDARIDYYLHEKPLVMEQEFPSTLCNVIEQKELKWIFV
jgi:hypothetical protein